MTFPLHQLSCSVLNREGGSSFHSQSARCLVPALPPTPDLRPFLRPFPPTPPSTQPIFPHSSHPVSTRPYRRFNAAAIRRRLHLIQSLRRGTGLRLPACLLAGRLLSIWPKLSSRPIVHLSCNVGIAQRHIRSLEACCRYFTNFTHIFFPWNRLDTLLLVSFQVFRPHHQAPPPSHSTKEILTCKGREPRFVFPPPLQGGRLSMPRQEISSLSSPLVSTSSTMANNREDWR